MSAQLNSSVNQYQRQQAFKEPVVTSSVNVDPAIDYSMVSTAQLAFGFSQQLPGYFGNTVTLKRTSDNTTQQFGFTNNARFNWAAVSAWAGSSSALAVNFIDQVGTGKLLIAVGVWTVWDGAGFSWYPSASQNWNTTDGTFTLGYGPTPVNEIIAIPVFGSYFELDNSGITFASGAEFHMAMCPMMYKRSASGQRNSVTGTDAYSVKGSTVAGNVSVTGGSSVVTFSSSQLSLAGYTIMTVGGQVQTITSGSGTSWNTSSPFSSTETNVTATSWLQKLLNYVVFSPDVTNTSVATMSVNGAARVPIVAHDGTALVGGELPAGSVCTVIYDDGHWGRGALGNPLGTPCFRIGRQNGDSTYNTYFSYGVGTNYWIMYSQGNSGGSFQNLSSHFSGGGGSILQPTNANPNTPEYKQYSLQVHTTRIDSSVFCHYDYGGLRDNTVNTNSAQLAGFGNGTLRICNSHPSISAFPANAGISAFLVTTTLTDFQRYSVQARMKNTALQGQMISVQTWLSKFDEILDARNINLSTGLLPGQMGKTSLQFNLTQTSGGTSNSRGAGVQFQNTPNWTLNYVVPNWGLTGVKSNDNNNWANTFKATNNYFSDVQIGSAFIFVVPEVLSLGQWFSLGTANPPVTYNYDNYQSLALGRHHSSQDFYTGTCLTLDPNNMINGGGTYNNPGVASNVSLWTDVLTNSQSMNKYTFNLTFGDWGSPAGPSSLSLTRSDGSTYPAGTYLNTIDYINLGNVHPTSPEDATWENNNAGCFQNQFGLMFHAGTFNPGPYWQKNASQTNRDKYVRTGVNWSYWTTGVGNGVGHHIESIAYAKGSGAVVYSDPNSTIQSNFYLGQGEQGTWLLMGFSKYNWSMAEIEQIENNLYKLYTMGYATTPHLTTDSGAMLTTDFGQHIVYLT